MRWWLLGGVGLAAACAEQDSYATACDAPVALTVTPGARPTFTWRPSCGVENLVVSEDDSLVVWLLESRSTRVGDPADRLVSNVRYGEVPSGAREVGRSEPLRKGHRYSVALQAFTPERGTRTVARAVFLP
jgi:hypothetical protein